MTSATQPLSFLGTLSLSQLSAHRLLPAVRASASRSPGLSQSQSRPQILRAYSASYSAAPSLPARDPSQLFSARGSPCRFLCRQPLPSLQRLWASPTVCSATCFSVAWPRSHPEFFVIAWPLLWRQRHCKALRTHCPSPVLSGLRRLARPQFSRGGGSRGGARHSGYPSPAAHTCSFKSTQRSRLPPKGLRPQCRECSRQIEGRYVNRIGSLLQRERPARWLSTYHHAF